MPSHVLDIPFDLNDPELFSDDRFLSLFASLRAESPIHFHSEADGLGFWVISRYRDIQTVYLDSSTYSSRWGMRLGNRAEAVEAVAGKMLTVSDPPDHTRARRVVAAAFSGKRLEYIEKVIDAVVDELFEDVLERQDCDFVERFARHLPTHAICAMMGLPREDWETVGALASDGLTSQDDETRLTANADIFTYFFDLVDERRRKPGHDLVSHLLLDSEKTGTNLSDEEIVVNLSGILTGANETTRYVVGGVLLAFVQHRDQWTLLKESADLVDRAVEEALRWTTPGVHTLRTVTADTELSGVLMRRGDRVTLWNCSANRDEDIFSDPDRFLIDRESNPHFSFGYGRHLCVGARLARMELRSYLHALRRKVQTIEVSDQVVWARSNFARGPEHIQVRLARA
jgi:cytochrome P450